MVTRKVDAPAPKDIRVQEFEEQLKPYPHEARSFIEDWIHHGRRDTANHTPISVGLYEMKAEAIMR